MSVGAASSAFGGAKRASLRHDPTQSASVAVVPRTLIRHRHGLWFLLAGSLLLLAWAGAHILAGELAPRTDTFGVSVAALGWLVIYLVSTTWAFGTVYLLTTAYVIPLVLFHFGLMAQDGFGFVSVEDFHGHMGHWMTLAGWYTNVALGCLGLGFAGAALLSHRTGTMTRESATSIAQRNLDRLRNLGIGLLLASGVFLAIGITQVGNILNYDRNTLFWSGMDIRGIGVFVSVLPTAAMALVISAQTRGAKRWSYALGAVTAVLFLLSGNRSTVYFPLLVGAVLWVKSGRRIPMPVAAGTVLLTLLMIPVLAVLRSEHKYGDISVHALVESSSQASIGSALDELGGSVATLATTLEAIPAQEPYRFGASYLGYLKSILPNVGLTQDLSKTDNALIQQDDVEKGVLQLSPAEWASLKILGIDDAMYQHAGVGFSAVAEPYFNFGLAGVVAYFVLLGVFLARMERSPLLLEYPWLVFASLYYWFFLETVRNQFGDFTKPASFVASSVLIWILVRPLTPFARR